MLAELREHPERFAALAQAHSRCSSAAQGGNLGQITRGQTTPQFEQALRRLRPDNCARRRPPPATAFTSSVSTASMPGRCCLMKRSPRASPIICARACDGGRRAIHRRSAQISGIELS